MIRLSASALAVALLGLAGCETTDRSASVPPMASATVGLGPGYLDGMVHRALGEAVPPSPVAGSTDDRADRAQSERYRGLEGGDRWMLATAHAEVRAPYAFAHFDCALGTRLNERPRPALQALFDKVLHDADEAAEIAKARLARPRPVADDPERRACQRLTDAQKRTPSHPSGSATVSVAYGEVLAELMPDRAAEVRASAGQVTLSRAICGMHYPRDVEDGADLGRAVAAAVIATPAFQADAVAARAELAAARAERLIHPACAAQRAALALPLP